MAIFPPAESAGGLAEVNLGTTATTTTVTVTNDAGDDAIIAAATVSAAGAMTAAQVAALNAAGGTDLGTDNIGASTLDITSSSGANVTVPAATSSVAGLMTAAFATQLTDGVTCLVESKPADTGRSSDNSPSADPDLTFNLGVKRYAIFASIAADADSNTPDLRIGLKLTGGTATGRWWFDLDAASASTFDMTASVPSSARALTTVPSAFSIRGYVIVTAGAPVLSVDWSQANSHADSSYLKAGSWVVVIPTS